MHYSKHKLNHAVLFATRKKRGALVDAFIGLAAITIAGTGAE